mgnify:CR=1 FL=1
MTISKEQRESITEIIEEELSNSNTPGLGVGVVQDGKILFLEGHGFENVEKEIKADPNTVFRWGSVSKLFTCIGIFQQWEQGKIKLDDPVNNYLGRGKIIYKKHSWPEVTFKHLLTHTAGIGELRRFSDILKPGFRLLTYDEKPVPPLNTIHDLNLPTQSPAGQKYAYANLGGSLLGFITERLSGESFQDYIINNIFTPLEMNNSDFDRSGRVNDRLALGYKYKKKQLKLAKNWNNIIKPSGGLYATLEDMANFAICLLNGGKFKDRQILKKETIDLIWTPHWWSHKSFKESNSVGYIFRIKELNGKKIIWHTGGMSGFTASFDLIPEDNIGFFTVANLSESLTNRITLRIRNRILKLLTGVQNHFKPGKVPDKQHWAQIKGYYGPYPGWLANTRIILDGIDFKVMEKNNHLILSGLINNKNIRLYPTEDPLVYEYPKEEGEAPDFTEKVAFTLDEERKKIVEMAKGFYVLRKNSFFNTFRFKLYLIIGAIIGIIILLVVFSILFS